MVSSIMTVGHPRVSFKPYLQNRVAEVKQNLEVIRGKVGFPGEIAEGHSIFQDGHQVERSERGGH